MKNWCCAILTLLVFVSCKREFEAPVPNLGWQLFFSPAAQPLATVTRTKLQGVYTVEAGEDDFGPEVAARWSYTVKGVDTTYHFSFFCQKDAGYFISEGRRLDSNILLNGYWRKMVSSETGKIQLTITKENGAGHLLSNRPLLPADSIIISGLYGSGSNEPATIIRLRYSRPLYNATPFYILAHRGGGRTADLLPASENSVEIIRLASRFGATGIEIDVQRTKDGVPVLFHDATLNDRVIQKNGLVGPVENYTYEQLNTLVRLTNGERIPTLREALETVLYQTPLQFVWLDTKYNGSLQVVKDLQSEFLQKAVAANRNVEIVIGIPDKTALENFKKLDSYASVPSLVEIDRTDAMAVNARIWAPQWTLGLQNIEVAQMQAQGRKVFTWTVDNAENIERYMRDGRLNGLLSNYPSLIAFYYYAQ